MAAPAATAVPTATPSARESDVALESMVRRLDRAMRAAEGDRLVRAGQWRGWHTMMMLGVQVAGKRLGIYGLGRIGQAVARRARGFDMIVHYHNRKALPPEQAHGAIYRATPEDLLRVSDFLTLHCPSAPETRGFLDARRIALLPKGAIAVNTARGDIVDDEALIAALKSGRVT
jgi:lactate dehydrogenase-like 2-hydroxyacid dehydrogenase